MTYKILRVYFEDRDSITIDSGLSLEQAQEHCQNPQTSSSTCTDPDEVEHTRICGAWFDCYTSE